MTHPNRPSPVRAGIRRAAPRISAWAAWGLGALLAAGAVQAQSIESAKAVARQALQSNPELASKLQAYLGSASLVEEAAAGWKPKLDLHASGGIDAVKWRGTDGYGRTKHLGAGLTLTQVLWDGLATRHEVDRTGHERMARWFEFVEASEQTSLEALRAMYDVQRTRKLVALAEENVRQHQDTAAKIESRVKAGVGRGVDLDQVRARLALAQSNFDTEVANLHDVASRYLRLVGEVPANDNSALESLRVGLPGSTGEAVQMAIERSPAVAAAIESLRAAKSGGQARKSAFQPKVEAYAEVNGGRNLEASRGREADAAVGLTLNWNLYNGGADTARQRHQASVIQQAMDLRDKACRDVRQSVAVAFAEHAKLTSQMASLSRNTAAIDRARDAYRQQFEIGQRSLLDLLNAENESYTARRSVTNAVFDRAVAAARTLTAMAMLNTTLEVARDQQPQQAQNWNAGPDGATRCPAQVIDVPGLRQGTDASLPWVTGSAAPVAVAMPVAAAAPLVRELDAAPLASERLAARASAEAVAAPATAKAISGRVQTWARSWRTKDLANLTALYAPDFKGEEPSAALWRAKQKKLLASQGFVPFDVADVTVLDLGNGQRETRFRQTPEGGEPFHKVLTWKQMDGQWRIASERGQ